MGKNTRCHLQCTKERLRPKCIFPNQFWESDREVPKILLFFHLSLPSYIVCFIWGSGIFAVLHVQIRGCTVNLSTPKNSNYHTHQFLRTATHYLLQIIKTLFWEVLTNISFTVANKLERCWCLSKRRPLIHLYFNTKSYSFEVT